MCTAKNYLKALEKEALLRLNGHITQVVDVEFMGEQNNLYKYEIKESQRTRAKFKDTFNALKSCHERNYGCYQVPENEVPFTQLKSENYLQIAKIYTRKDKESQKQAFFVELKNKIKSGFILGIAPSITQILTEIEAMENISGYPLHSENDILNKQKEAQKTNCQLAPIVLQKLFKTDKISLPEFKKQKLDEKEYFILTDGKRPGCNEQRDFVNTVLSTPDFAILNGPPGSGKSTVILETILQLVKRNQRILLVASTNVAVDNIIEKLSKHLDKASVKRYGKEDNDCVSFEAKKFLVKTNFRKTEFETLKERLKKQLNAHSTNKEQNLLHELEMENGFKNNEMLFEILESNAPIVAGTTFTASIAELKKLKNKGEDLEEPPFDYLIIDEASKTTIQEFLVPARLCKHWVIVGDPKQLSPYVDDADLATNIQTCYPDDYDKRLEFRVASDAFLAKSGMKQHQHVYLIEKTSEMDAFHYRKYANEFEVLFADADKDEYDAVLPYAEIIVGSLNSFEEKKHLISSRITTVRPATDKFTHKVLHEEAIAPWENLARYNREKLLNRYDENTPKEWHDEMSWRLVRIFEQRENKVNAGHSTPERLEKEIADLIPISNSEEAKKGLEIFKQIYLPSCMELLLKGYGKFKELALFRGLGENNLNQRYVSLSYQHRSLAEIAQFASQEFYGGKQMLTAQEKPNPYQGFFDSAVTWIDVKGKCDEKMRNKKERNRIVDELKKLKKHLKKKKEKTTIAVLSFYKEQAESLEKICKEIFKGEKNIRYDVGTVDSFQGHEADIVFLSYSNSHATCFLDAPNRYNVAITRAKFQMVHVGNFNSMKNNSGSMGRIINKITPQK